MVSKEEFSEICSKAEGKLDGNLCTVSPYDTNVKMILKTGNKKHDITLDSDIIIMELEEDGSIKSNFIPLNKITLTRHEKLIELKK